VTGALPPPHVHETHVSYVFLFGDLAVKLKKPAHFEFIDLSTPELRREACRREVELNRRLAPDVYLGVDDIVDESGAVRDHVVVMRRMPDDRRLSTLVRARAVSSRELRDLAHVIATFHSGAERSDAIDAVGRADAIGDRWQAGFREVRPFAGPVLDAAVEDEIETLVERYLAGRTVLFDERIAHGKIRDGHGDLLADDIFLLDDGPRVLDCLEFDDSLRYGDVLADVAFLAMDLERLGATDLAERFLDEYRELNAETWPATLAHHYGAFRAHIRAKVACFRHAQGDPDAAAEARRLLELCRAHLRRGRVTLTLVGGAPGTGKTTLAGALGDRLDWTVLRSDLVRKDLAGVAHDEHAATSFGHGIYDDATTEATYAELITRAEMLLRRGEPVVLDATWASAIHRRAARELAAQTTSELVEVQCIVDPDTAARRVATRAQHGRDASDATPQTATLIATRFDPWPEARPIDTTQPVGRLVDTIGTEVLGP